MHRTVSVLLTAVLAACATVPRSATGPQYSVISRDDQFAGGTLVAMHNNFLPSGPGEPKIAIGAARIQLPTPDSAHHLWIVDYYGGEWAFIAGEYPLTFLVDGQPIRFDALETPQGEAGPGNFAERGVYLASARDIRRVAAGNNVRVQVGGTRGTIERPLDAENLARLRAFVAQHLR